MRNIARPMTTKMTSTKPKGRGCSVATSQLKKMYWLGEGEG